MTLNKSERATITGALDALGQGDTAAARGLLAGLLDAKPAAPASDARLAKADEKVRAVLLSHTWQYEHRGSTTTGTVWASTATAGGRWVVNNYSGELHKVDTGGKCGRRTSDGHAYAPTGKLSTSCTCGGCARQRTEAERASLASVTS